MMPNTREICLFGGEQLYIRPCFLLLLAILDSRIKTALFKEKSLRFFAMTQKPYLELGNLKQTGTLMNAVSHTVIC